MFGFELIMKLGGPGHFIQMPSSCCFPPSGAPQKGTNEHVDTSYMTAQSAVYRNGSVYAVGATTIFNPERESIQWVKFNPESGEVLDSGLIDDPTGEFFYGYPSVAVNRSGAMLIGFGTFSKNQYPSAGYAYRDTLGRVSTAGTIKSGNTPYLRARDFNGQRWGDYTATVVDPTMDNAFWTLQMAALDTHWVTWWAKVETGPASSRRRSARH